MFSFEKELKNHCSSLSKVETQIISTRIPGDKMYAGFDISMSNTGLAFLYREGDENKITMASLKPPAKSVGMKRLDFAAREFDKLCFVCADGFQNKKTLVSVEGYAMGIKSGKAFDIGEFTGAAKLVLYRNNIDTILVPPTTLKKFMTSNGRAEKNVMMKRLYSMYGVDSNDNNQTDAACLAFFSAVYENSSDAPKYQKDTTKNASVLG